MIQSLIAKPTWLEDGVVYCERERRSKYTDIGVRSPSGATQGPPHSKRCQRNGAAGFLLLWDTLRGDRA